ncbi:MAG: hypothetical protein ABII12_03140 [Planctomycetota bacterium]
MSKDDNKPETPASAPAKPAAEFNFKTPIPLPDWAVLIQKVAGPIGIDPKFGMVVIGGVVTTSVNIAAERVSEPSAEFTPYGDESTVKIRRYLADQQVAAGKKTEG